MPKRKSIEESDPSPNKKGHTISTNDETSQPNSPPTPRTDSKQMAAMLKDFSTVPQELTLEVMRRLLKAGNRSVCDWTNEEWKEAFQRCWGRLDNEIKDKKLEDFGNKCKDFKFHVFSHNFQVECTNQRPLSPNSEQKKDNLKEEQVPLSKEEVQNGKKEEIQTEKKEEGTSNGTQEEDEENEIDWWDVCNMKEVTCKLQELFDSGLVWKDSNAVKAFISVDGFYFPKLSNRVGLVSLASSFWQQLERNLGNSDKDAYKKFLRILETYLGKNVKMSLSCGEDDENKSQMIVLEAPRGNMSIGFYVVSDSITKFGSQYTQ